jgi:glycosyltransferase involved in cell wall biosynthesis
MQSTVVRLDDLPQPPSSKTGWPWTEESLQLPDTLPDGSPWPCISIVTPSYNQGQFIEETIRSVLLQGYPNLEYIIIDGGSTDNSVEIIKKYSPWLAYWVSEKDRGQSHAINKGWERAHGEIIAYLNSDDIYTPGALEIVAKSFRKESNFSAVVGKTNYINTSSQFIGISQKPYVSSESPCDLSLVDPDLWFLPQPSSFWYRPILEKAGMFVREDLHYTMDRELFYRTSKIAKIALTDKPLASFRIHEHNKSISQRSMMYKEDAVALKYSDDGNSLHRLIKWRNARWWLARGYFFEMRKNTCRARVLRNMMLVIFYRPGYLAKKHFYRQLFRSLAPDKLLNIRKKVNVP